MSAAVPTTWCGTKYSLYLAKAKAAWYLSGHSILTWPLQLAGPEIQAAGNKDLRIRISGQPGSPLAPCMLDARFTFQDIADGYLRHVRSVARHAP